MPPCIPKATASCEACTAEPHAYFERYENCGLKTLPQHPKLAPDFNAIENVWDLLQDRLLLTAPVEMESRTDFTKRLQLVAACFEHQIIAN